MRTLLMLSAALLLAAPAVAAQASPFSLEVRGRAAFPTGDFGEEEDGIGVETGWGGSLEGHFQATPLLGVYAGYSHTRFPTDLGELEELLGDDASVDITDAGFDAGARITLPLLNGGAFVRGGVVYHRASVDLSEELLEFFEALEPAFDEDDLESDWSLGYQLGAGALVPLGQRLSASVGAAYTRYEPEYEDSSTTEVSSEDLSYVSVEVGLQIRL